MTPVRHRSRWALRWLAVLGACLLAIAAAAADQATAPPASLDDGPYVFHAGERLEALWVCGGEVQRLSVAHGKAIPPRCGYPHPALFPALLTPAASVAPASKRVVVVSDMHGQFELARRLLRANGVIDADDNWALGRDQLVITGDVFDRGAGVNDILWLLLRLQQQAQQAGGGAHFLLGNHEVIALAGDLRYVNPEYLQVARLLRRSYPGLYARDSVLGQWLRTRPTVFKLGDTLFLHGGIAPENIDLATDLAATNDGYRAMLGTSKPDALANPSTARLYEGKKSPIWYRGYFDGQMTTEEIGVLTEHLGVTRIVVGHTTLQHVSSLHGGRVIAVDSGLKRGITGELLFIEDGKLSRGLLDGSRVPLREYPGAPPKED